MSLIRARRALHSLVWVVPVFVFLFVLSILIGASPFTGGGRGAGGGGMGGPGEARFARIDGQDIPQRQFEESLERLRDQMTRFSGGPVQMAQLAESPRFAYEQLLNEYAEAAAARSIGINVSSAEADSAARDRIESILKERGEGLTASELQDTRHMMMAAVDTETERRQLAGTQLRSKLEADARPVEVQVAHVLVKTETRTPEAALKLGTDIARQARAGADFAKLAAQHSEDAGSKAGGGVAGWASAMPPTAADPKKPKKPDEATSFVPEFTAAALRLRPGQVSDPVKSKFGYHVIKVLQERNYEPTDAESKKDPKKRTEAIDSYKRTLANQVAQGLVEQFRQQIKVEASSPWLRAYLAEQKLNLTPVFPGDEIKPLPPAEVAKLTPVIADYEAARKANGREIDEAFTFRLAQLYTRAGQHQQAFDLLDRVVKKRPNGELAFALGATLEKLNKKTEALAAYEKALEQSYSNPELVGRIGDRFKALGRTDLMKKAQAKQGQQLAQRAAEQQKQQAEFQRMMLEQQAKAARERAAAAPAGNAPAPGGIVPPPPAGAVPGAIVVPPQPAGAVPGGIVPPQPAAEAPAGGTIPPAPKPPSAPPPAAVPAPGATPPAPAAAPAGAAKSATPPGPPASGR